LKDAGIGMILKEILGITDILKVVFIEVRLKDITLLIQD